MMRMGKLRNIRLQDAAHILFPRRMASYGFRCFSSKLEDAAREDKLDFITASKLLFTAPSKPKKFGIDFHLVQFFFACMPSLAVYLVAQYARYDMRKMEAELEEKRRLTEETLAEEAGPRGKRKLHGKLSNMSEVSRKGKEEALQELKHRLDTLEAIVKDMTSTEARKSSNANRSAPHMKQKEQPVNEKVALTRGERDVDKNHGESSMKQEEEPVNENVALTRGERDIDKNHGESSKSKDTAPVDNANSESAALQPDKNSPAGDDSPNVNQGSKNGGLNSEINK